MFRRLLRTVIEPGFLEVADFASEQGVTATVDCELGGVQPRAMFCIRPSGRSIRFQLDADGESVRVIEGASRWGSAWCGLRSRSWSGR